MSRVKDLDGRDLELRMAAYDNDGKVTSAALIAAAPDLLAAAEACLFMLETGGSGVHATELDSCRATGTNQPLGDVLRAAIARARGAVLRG